jgi:hypothetical protein
MEKLKLPRLAYNWISTAGAIMAVITALVILFLLILNFLANITNPYVGIFIYMVLPPVMVFGLILVPVGMWREWRRWLRGEKASELKWPYIDLNQRSHRNAFIVFLAGTVVFIIISAVGSYQAYHFTESVTFCGKTCHSVMNPEYTAYQNSPHARVPCTSCHVGPGAGWYTKSKLSGLYQVYAVVAHVYPKPIPTPVKNLRPAQETCEECHWPRQFYGGQQRRFDNYRYDENNTPWPINMLIKTGGGDPKTGQVAGIHWHMNIGFRVEYIARDERRQNIPWVKVSDRQTGRITVYQDISKPLTKEEIAASKPRIMDCMDCHNRPSHVYRSPDYAINLAILTGRVDGTLPDIKKIAVEAMAKDYDTHDAGLLGIANYITDYYRLNHADLYGQKRKIIDDAILAAQQAFSQNIFPEMKVRWSEYPNNIGHFISVGCMRCHLGNHRSDDGIVLTHDCKACHIILEQGSGQLAQASTSEQGLEFRHPEDIGDAWKESGCYECHTGVQP